MKRRDAIVLRRAALGTAAGPLPARAAAAGATVEWPQGALLDLQQLTA